MATRNEIEGKLEKLTAPGFRGKLLARGLARELIWRDGELPEGAPAFSTELTTDLTDYGFNLLRLGLELRTQGSAQGVLDLAFRTSAEAIEATVRNGDPGNRARGFYRVMAAAAYHLAHYSARAYCLVGSNLDDININPAERSVALLMRRALRQLETESWGAISSASASDNELYRSLDEGTMTEDDVLQTILNKSIARAVNMFIYSLETGDVGSQERAIAVLEDVVSAASDLGFVTLWWLSYVTRHLIEDLWGQSLHVRITPSIPASDAEWRLLRRKFIGVLWSRDVAEIELWPSQLEAAKRVQDPTDDLVAALPTGAGKTRIAELAILRTLADGNRVIYVTPLRSLSAQLEQSLRRTFQPLGFTVSSLYGASGSTHLDIDSLKNRPIVVSTPEKLDFALRNDASLIEDVGLIVLDEGHMIGAGEREVRYEVLVQRLLRRPDADSRRIVCLSAILPQGEKLSDFVAWLRSDQPGEAIACKWRPSRQRFGTIIHRGNHARLDLHVETETPFVPYFLTQRFPDPRSKRRKIFPADRSELVLASAWEFVNLDQGVLIFCPLRKSVDKLARLVLQLNKHLMLSSLLDSAAEIKEALQIGTEWLGEDHPAVSCLKLGVAIHHAKLPKQFLHAIEGLLSAKVLKVVIASPTLAQGLNLSAATVIMNSIHRGQDLIKGEEFANVAGRAGRAFVDIDGQVLYPIFEQKQSMIDYKLSAWGELVEAAHHRNLTSGILQLVILLFQRLKVYAEASDKDAVLEYVLNNSDWESVIAPDKSDAAALGLYEEQLRSLDGALLSLIDDLKCTESAIAAALDVALKNSLWMRQLKNANPGTQKVLRAILESRAKHIWTKTTAAQRRGFYYAGIGVEAGLAIDGSLDDLITLIGAGEEAQRQGNAGQVCDAVTKFAEIVFSIAPFTPEPLPQDWQKVLYGWLLGLKAAELQAISEDATEFIQDGICYKLTWALEAVRVRATTHQPQLKLDGSLTAALDVGALKIQEILMLRGGLRSRIAASKVVLELAPTFKTFKRMHLWLLSYEVQKTLKVPDWPSEETAAEWRRFVQGNSSSEQLEWSEHSETYTVQWAKSVSTRIGDRVRLYTDEAGATHIFSLELNPLGQLGKIDYARSRGPQVAVVGPEANEVTVSRFGPNE